MIRFALSARTSTDDLQSPEDSLRWQTDVAVRLISPHGGAIVATYHDIDQSRSLPWDRRPEASRILQDIKNPNRGWDALVIAEPQRAFSGTQFDGILHQFKHYGVGLWLPELGGAVDIDNDSHYMALANYGSMGRAERNRTRVRVKNAMGAHAQVGRWLGGRPPYGYRIGDLGPHPNPSKAASGQRLHQLEIDPDAAPVVKRIFAMFIEGHGYGAIASTLNSAGIPSPSAHDPARNTHRNGNGWAKSAIRAILTNPRYLGYHVSGRTQKTDRLIDPDNPSYGHVTRQVWQDPSEWVTANEQTYEPIIDEEVRKQVEARIGSRTAPRRSSPVRRAEPSRYPLAGLVICDHCGKRLQGNTSQGRAFYRCKASGDYPANDHPPTLSVREDRLLPRVDAWLCQLFSPEHIDATAASVVEADSQRNEEDPEIVRARRVIAQCDRKLETHLRGLEQGIPADLIAPRIEATQKEKAEATTVLAGNRPKASPLTIEQVTETLSQLRDVPELLACIDQADRAELYRHLHITLTYKREEGTEKVRLTCTPSGVDQNRVGGGT